MEEVTGTINRFIFQIINSLIESWGVHFTLTIKNYLHCVLTAPQVTSLLLFGPQAIPVTRWPCWTMYNACKILVFLLQRMLNNVLCMWNINILIAKVIKTNKQTKWFYAYWLHVELHKWNRLTFLLLRMLFTKAQNNIRPATISLSSTQVWLVTL